jgi:cation diffusion facilitator family transporter
MSDDLIGRHKKTRFITFIGALFNLLLALLKCLAGWFGHSHALFADGIHSLSDLFADLVVYFSSKLGNEQADYDHPYGHHRIETLGTVVVAVFLAATAITIIISGVEHALAPHADELIHSYVLWIAVFSLLINEIIYHVTLHIATKIDSDLLRAHAWHRRSDAATSLIVLIGIGASFLGFTHLDAIAAVVVGVFILKMAWQMGRKSLDELVDRGLNQTELLAISEAIQSVSGVEALHQLRTRLMGGQIYADVHIIVKPRLSVSEGHYIGDHVLMQLQRQFSKINDITIHVDVENDELQHDADALISRAEILTLLAKLAPQLPYYEQMQLKAIHYFKNTLTLELLFLLNCLVDVTPENLQKIYYEKISGVLSPVQLEIYFCSPLSRFGHINF